MTVIFLYSKRASAVKRPKGKAYELTQSLSKWFLHLIVAFSILIWNKQENYSISGVTVPVFEFTEMLQLMLMLMSFFAKNPYAVN